MFHLPITFAAFVTMAIVCIIGIGLYLSPDGLSGCKPYPTKAQDCEAVDAIVAVSGGDTQARTDGAIELYKSGWAPILIFSGAAADKTGPSNAEAMRQQAIAEGVNPRDIILDETSETTKENANNSVNIFEKYDIHSVILVTSPYHQRRAGLEFGQRAGMNVKIINHPLEEDAHWNEWWWLSPSGWWLASSELVKIMAFYAGATK